MTNNKIITAHRYHDISYGHRVYQHESKCARLHGHNGRIHFYAETNNLDFVGRVIDFSILKSTMCDWVEDNWDHRFLIYEKDPWAQKLIALDSTIKIVPFNPTSENMALYLLTEIGPHLLKHDGVHLTKVTFEETRKCAATAEIDRRS
jgi:6-pyruvoyltetrahydropterin/6-carboxytetrahydropterin synthase